MSVYKGHCLNGERFSVVDVSVEKRHCLGCWSTSSLLRVRYEYDELQGAEQSGEILKRVSADMSV